MQPHRAVIKKEILLSVVGTGTEALLLLLLFAFDIHSTRDDSQSFLLQQEKTGILKIELRSIY